MIEVIVMIPDRSSQARICEGLRLVARCIVCAGVAEVWPALVNARARGAHVGAVVLAARDPDGGRTDALVAALRARSPAVPVIAFCVLDGIGAVDILALARAGVSGLILRGVDDDGLALRSALTSARDDCAADYIMGALGPALPGSVRVIIEYCVLHGRRPLTVAGVARGVGVNRKTLVTRLANAGLPQPRAIIAWSRLCLVTHALEDDGLAVERAAMDFGFASAPALRNLCKRYTGLRFGEVRRNGGLACILHLFARALRVSEVRLNEHLQSHPLMPATTGSG